jgi:hypothetical protein
VLLLVLVLLLLCQRKAAAPHLSLPQSHVASLLTQHC